MIDIKPFVEKIIEQGPEIKRIHTSFEEYKKHGEYRDTGLSPYFRCVSCDERHAKKNLFSANCDNSPIERTNRVHKHLKESDLFTPWGWMHYYCGHRYYPNNGGHRLIEVVTLKTELGDFVLRERNSDRGCRDGRITESEWLRSECSPLYRGFLLRDENGYNPELHQGFRHYPLHMIEGYWRWYRKPKTLNERKAYEATTFGDDTPNVRAKRNSCNLENAWDDKHAHRDRTWKRKKVRKQWAVNID